MMLIPLLAALFLVVSGRRRWEDHRLEPHLHHAHEEEALSHLERLHPPRGHKGGRHGDRLKPLGDETMPLDWDPEEGEEVESLRKEWREKRRGHKKGKGKKEKKEKGERGKGKRPSPPVDGEEETEDDEMQE